MRPGRIAKAACWAYAGRKLFELADIVSKAHSQKPTAISPIALRRVIKTPDSDFGENCLEGGLSFAILRRGSSLLLRRISPLVADIVAKVPNCPALIFLL
jgi:hypothetical protein